MENSLEDRNRDIPVDCSFRNQACQANRRPRPRSSHLLSLYISFLLYAAPAFAQNTSAAYRATVLAIQKQIEANHLDEARALAITASKRYPGDGGLDNLVGVIHIEQGDEAGARKAFSAAIRHSPNLASAYMNLSRIDMRTAATDQAARIEALQLSEKAAHLQPANDETNYQIAVILSWEKSYERSLTYLEKLSPEARKQVGAEALLCADEAALGRREAGRAAAALASNPDLTEQDADACLPALRTARRADLIDTIFAAANGRQPLSAAGLRTFGLAEEAEGKLVESRATLERAYAADSTREIVLEDLARVARAAKDDRGALGYLAHARDLKPNNASLAYEFGAICLEMGLYAESRKALEEAVKLAPDSPEYNLGLGTVVSFSEDPSQALPYLTKYRALRPHDPAGALALGATYFRAKEYDTAATWLRQAVTDAKSAPDAYFYLGRIAREEGHTDEAIHDLKQSLALRPNQPNALAEIGQICVTTRNYDQAATYLDRAIELDRDNYAANFGLLEMYARTNDPRRAQQSTRFDEIKAKKEQWDRDLMRVLEIRRDSDSNNPQ
jgi:tetratricopeptide (TPR) repeat protein